jgi:hypothetical protein
VRFVTWILDHWRIVLVGMVILLVTALYTRLQTVTAQRDIAEGKIAEMRSIAQTYDTRSKEIADETGSAFTLLVEQIKDKDIALNAARARFGSFDASRGAPTIRLPAQHGSGQADSTGEPDGATEERVAVPTEFINDCALDAGRLDAWRSWAVKNELPVSKD